jgi:WD40 repeat protein
VAFNEEESLIAVDNTFDGYDLYQFGTGSYIRTLPTARVISPRLARQIVFGENGNVLVGGGNDRRITVFDRRNGACLDTLQHESSCRSSQTVTVSIKSISHLVPI